MATASIDTAALRRDIAKATKKLQALQVKTQKVILRKSVRAAQAPVLKALRAASPKNRGRFKRTLKQEVLTAADGKVHGRVGQDRKKAKVGGVVHIHIIDQGTKPHQIIKGRFRDDYGDLPKGPYSHPGQPGQVFVEKTQQRTKAISLRAFEKKTAKEVDAEAAKLAAL